MHIEISAGGLSGGIAVASFQNGMKKYISGTDGMISSFKAVKTKTYNLNGGGPGQHLSGALENISQRIRTEEDRRRGAETVQAKSNSFLDLAVRVDERVSKMVKQDRKELYGKYPSLKPSAGQWIKDRLSDAWNWLCKAGKDIANAAEKTWNAIKDTAQKAWNSIVTFYQEHKQIIDTILIVVGAIAAIAAVVVTGGLALAPLIGAGLTALGVSAATAASIAAVTSAVVGVTAIVSTIGASTMNVIDIWADKSDDATFQAWKKVFNVVSIVTNTLYSIGNLYNAYKGTTGTEYLAQNRASNTPEALPAGSSSASSPVADNAAPKVNNAKAQRIAAEHPEAAKSVSMDDIATQTRTPQTSEYRVEMTLGDNHQSQVTIGQDFKQAPYGSKGSIRLDDAAGWDANGNPLNLHNVKDFREVSKFDVTEVKNYSIETARGRASLKRNIIKQATQRNKILSQAGAEVHQTYVIDVVGHGKISIGQISDFYERLIKALPSNVDIDFGTLLK